MVSVTNCFNTQGDIDVMSLNIYASWFSPSSLGKTLRNVCYSAAAVLNTLCRQVNDYVDIFLN